MRTFLFLKQHFWNIWLHRGDNSTLRCIAEQVGNECIRVSSLSKFLSIEHPLQFWFVAIVVRSSSMSDSSTCEEDSEGSIESWKHSRSWGSSQSDYYPDADEIEEEEREAFYASIKMEVDNDFVKQEEDVDDWFSQMEAFEREDCLTSKGNGEVVLLNPIRHSIQRLDRQQERDMFTEDGVSHRCNP